MTRDMSLTLLLMVSSVAAAVAAPGEGHLAASVECSQSRTVAAALPAERGMAEPVPVALKVKPRAALSGTGACLPDAGAAYRQWHHGSLKLNLDCAPASGA